MPEDDRVPLDVDAAPPGPAGELGVLPRRDVGVGLAVPLDELLEHDRAGRHVDAERERLGREHRLDQPAREELLDDLLEGRQQPGVVRGEPALEALEPLPVARGPRGPRRGCRRTAPRRRARISSRSSGVVRRTPHDRHCWTAASQPARLKMKMIAGSSPARSSCSTTSARLGVPRPGRPRGGRRPRPRWLRTIRLSSRDRRRSSGLTRAGPGTTRPSAAVIGVSSANRSYIRWPDHHVLPQRHRAVLGDDHLGVAAHGVEPVAELLGVADRRRERHDAGRRPGRWMITSSQTAPRNRSAR